jgi:hypothetical protein
MVQAPEVHFLLLVVRFTRAKHIQAAGPGLYAGQLIQIPEAEAQDEIVLVRRYVLSQNNLARVFFVGLLQPLGRTPASSRFLI